MSANPAPARPELAPYDAPAFARDTGVNPSAMADIETFRAQLEETNRSLNLVADSTLPQYTRRGVESASR